MSASLEFTPRQRAEGFVKVVCTEGVYSFTRSEGEAIGHACDAGEKWYTGDDMYGVGVRVRIDTVESVVVWTPEAIKRYVQDDDAARAERRAHGIITGDGDDN